MKRASWVAIVAAVLFLAGYAYARFWRAPGEEELERLRQEQRMLDGLLKKRLAEAARVAEAPEASVVVGVSARFAERFAGEVVTSLFSEVRLRLRDIKVEKEGELRGRVLVGRGLLGRYALSVRLDEVEAVLRAGKPRLRFAGDRVAVALPVSLTEGSGRGRLRFRWDGRGVAGVVCGDVAVEGEVGGAVVPALYTLEGAFRLAAEGPTVVARPEFEEVRLKVRTEPSSESWELVEKTIREQGAVCRAALKAADLPEKVRSLVGRGFTVTLPRKLFREVRLPVKMQPSVDLQGTAIRFEVRPAGLSLTPVRLWYGADVSLVGSPAAMPAPAQARSQ